jgi:hypothetical protein
MTVALDYTDLRFDDDPAVLLAEEGDFHYELLFARIVFRVDDADFSIQDEEVPLLDFSFVLRTVALELPDGETADYESPLSWLKIIFVRSGEAVGLSSNFTDATATVALSKLRDAAAAFHERVMQDLLIRYPGLSENSSAQKFFVPGSRGSSLDA